MNNNKNFLDKKLSIECAICKTKFEIWISTANYTPELEENIRKNFYRYCPVCKALESLRGEQK